MYQDEESQQYYLSGINMGTALETAVMNASNYWRKQYGGKGLYFWSVQGDIIYLKEYQ